MSAAERMHVSLDGFEGPLDLLLNLARTQKVDLAKISILELAEQYLQFIAEARALRLEIAADYLVTAAWLAFLKSKLLLPVEEKQDEGPSGQEMALHLAFRLKRLEAMRDAVARIFNRAQQGLDFFARGEPEGIRTVRKSDYWASVYDLLKAYAEQRGRNAQVAPVKMGGRKVWSIREARERMQRLFGMTINWSILDSYIEEYLPDPEVSKTAIASSFGATLELTREGFTEIRQAQAFAPIYIRWLKPKPSQGAESETTSIG
ncbi:MULTISPECIES: ScpA family protein [Rhodomicrobium]|uniref:segregation and condensation protein A n=1 Tax=Rhodomicrobium TaxID=1068 RepID=UPI000B4B5A68|nr:MULTISPECIES: ScpA family protein [Rhodomicrobium]